MKTTIKTGAAAIMLLLAASCTKDINHPPVANQSTDNQSTQRLSFTIGQSYGGGKIFYIDNTGQHGLIAALADQTPANSGVSWYNGTYVVTGATHAGIGSGAKNTKLIIAAQGKTGSYAALLCKQYHGGGFTDWYLPSKNELNALYKKRNIIGGFQETDYWSSTESDMNNAGDQVFQSIGYQFNDDKSFTLRVRAIRAF